MTVQNRKASKGAGIWVGLIVLLTIYLGSYLYLRTGPAVTQFSPIDLETMDSTLIARQPLAPKSLVEIFNYGFWPCRVVEERVTGVQIEFIEDYL